MFSIGVQGMAFYFQNMRRIQKMRGSIINSIAIMTLAFTIFFASPAITLGNDTLDTTPQSYDAFKSLNKKALREAIQEELRITPKQHCEQALIEMKSYAAAQLNQNAESPRVIKVLVIDGGHPDNHHPDFSRGQSSMLKAVDAYEYNDGAELPLNVMVRATAAKEQDKPLTWRAKFVRWWFTNVLNGAVARRLSKETEIKRILTRTLPLASVAAAGYAYVAKDDPSFMHNLFQFYKNHLNMAFFAPLAHQLAVNIPTIVSPVTAIRLRQQIHPTHVAGTVARGFSEMRDNLEIHTMDMNEVTGTVPSDPVYDSGPKAGLRNFFQYIKRKWEQISLVIQRLRPVPGQGRSNRVRPHSFEEEANVFLENYFAMNEVYLNGVAAYIKAHGIEAVNMSYGINRQNAIRSFVAAYEAEFGINPAPGTALAEKIVDGFRQQYQKLFQSCPNTAFFIAAGNDGDSVFNGESVLENISMQNVFISAAANDNFQLSRFSSFGNSAPAASAVSSAGLGEYRLSSLPGGGTTRLSGTSMASPENMLLYSYLRAMDSSLTVEEGMNLLRRGVIRDESLRSEVQSGGVTFAPRVFMEFLLFELQKQGFLKSSTLAPYFHMLPEKLRDAKQFLINAPVIAQTAETLANASEIDIDAILNKDKDATIDAIHALNVDNPAYWSLLQMRQLMLMWTIARSDKATGFAKEQIAKYVEERLSYINRRMVESQRELLPYFLDQKQQQELLQTFGVGYSISTHSFREFLQRHTIRKLSTGRFDNSDLVLILEAIRSGLEPSADDIDFLHTSLIQGQIKKQFIQTLYARMKVLLPQYNEKIDGLISR